MPHMLIAGTTGSGKSVCMNTIMMSFLYTKKPNELKLVLVDPKMVEMSQFKDIPHLMCPVVTEMSKAAAILEWAVGKMDERYELLAEAGCRDIAAYNELDEDELIDRFTPGGPGDGGAQRAGEGAHPAEAPLHGVHHRRARGPDDDQQGGRGRDRPDRAEGAGGGHPPDPGDAAPAGERGDGPDQGQHAVPDLVQGRERAGLRIVLDQKGGELLLGQGDMLFLSPSSHKLIRSAGHAGGRQGDPQGHEVPQGRRGPELRAAAGAAAKRAA
jgi:S-DNA-T family DNA segregation ATPase FtsK/SpoIIIE